MTCHKFLNCNLLAYIALDKESIKVANMLAQKSYNIGLF